MYALHTNSQYLIFHKWLNKDITAIFTDKLLNENATKCKRNLIEKIYRYFKKHLKNIKDFLKHLTRDIDVKLVKPFKNTCIWHLYISIKKYTKAIKRDRLRQLVVNQHIICHLCDSIIHLLQKRSLFGFQRALYWYYEIVKHQRNALQDKEYYLGGIKVAIL